MKRQLLDVPGYLEFPLVDVPRTVALGVELTRAVPRSSNKSDADEMGRIRPAAKLMREGFVSLQQNWLSRALTRDPLVRPFDIDFDAAAAAVLARLEPWALFASVPDDRAKKAARAAAIIALLFPKRLDFTRLELKSEWAEGKKRLDIIEKEKLGTDMNELVGEPFVARFEETHRALGRGLGLVGEPPEPGDAPVDLMIELREIREAIRFYLLQLTAAYPTGSDDLAKAIRAALTPIDELRAEQAKLSAPGASAPEPKPPVDPSTPIPPLPDE